MKRLLTLILMLVPIAVSAQSIEELADILWHKSSCRELTAERRAAMEAMQKHADNFTHIRFSEYNASAEGSALEQEIESEGIIRFYALAMEKLLKEIPTKKVKNGEVAIWQLYNMGYVVKTKTQCFGIDLHHKHATKLAPMIDFLLTTHNHGDHYSKALIAEMERLGKPVYSNFLSNGYKLKDGDKFTVGNIEIQTATVDHNKQLRKFVTTYQVNCYAKGKRPYVILFTGDAHNYEQLNPTQKVDMFVPHLAVGLNMPKAIEKINPTTVLMSHILELGHAIDKWRWSYAYGIDQCEKQNREGVYLPVWGEMIVTKR